MKRSYWMADEPKVIIDELSNRHGRYSVWDTNPLMSAWARNVYAYNSTVLDASGWETGLMFEGEQGELVKMAVPQARSLLRQLVTLITKKRMAFNCIAETKGMDVMADVRLGNSVTEQIIDDERLDLKGDLLCESSLIYGAAFMKSCWRTDKGDPYMAANDGSIVYTGSIDITVHSPLDVFYQYNIPTWDEQPWAEVRLIKNRWDLVAQHPDMIEKILALPSVNMSREMAFMSSPAQMDDDLVYVFEVYHKPTPAIPKGRMLMYSDRDTVYHDGENTYGNIPLEPMMPEKIDGMCLGYPFFSNLLPCQEMLDHSFSAIATNQSAFAVQNIAVARGAAVSVQEINGMNFISYTPQNVSGGGKPEPLQLTQSSPETFKFIDSLYTHLQQLSNINSALRGTPPPGVTAGNAIATLTTNALEFLNGFQKSYDLCLEKTIWNAISATKRFAKIERSVKQVGKNNQSYTRSYKGDDLKSLKGVKIIQVNPVMQTLAGRLNIAENLIQAQLVKTPQEYIALLEGAPLRQLYEVELSEDDLIQNENESMMDGRQVIALSTDDHAMHIRKHKTLLNDPMVRLMNDKVQMILAHLEEHKTLAQQTDPQLMAMALTGQMPQGGPPPQQGGAPQLAGQMMPEGEGLPEGQPAQPAEDMLGRQ